MPNLMPARDREVSVTRLDAPLTAEALHAYFLGREVYRRTAFILARQGDRAALLRVIKASEEPLFSPVVDLEVLAGADQCAVVRAPAVDTANATQMARAARTFAPSARCVVVEGRYEHVSFILDPLPLRITVLDVIPPEPPKLLDQAERILDVAEDLPPIELVPKLVDLRELARRVPAQAYLFPCRGGGLVADGAATFYLDERPPYKEWALVGCARSRELYRWFYREEPTGVDTCPRVLLGCGNDPTLTKCCLLEKQVRREGNAGIVPWGATLEEIRQGLEDLVRIAEPAWSAA